VGIIVDQRAGPTPLGCGCAVVPDLLRQIQPQDHGVVKSGRGTGAGLRLQLRSGAQAIERDHVAVAAFGKGAGEGMGRPMQRYRHGHACGLQLCDGPNDCGVSITERIIGHRR
jgi:hypothetical protein